MREIHEKALVGFGIIYAMQKLEMEKMQRAVIGYPKLSVKADHFPDVIDEFNAKIIQRKEVELSDEEGGICKIDLSRRESEESDWDTDLEERNSSTVTAKEASRGEKIYLKACKSLKITPSNHVLKSLKTSVLHARHRAIGPKEIQSIADALITNTFVKTLDIEANNIGPVGTTLICRVLQENCFITDVNLAENDIGSKGAAALGSMLKSTRSLVNVNLKGNRLSDKDSAALSHGIAGNDTVKRLNLSHNEFRSAAGREIGSAITTNQTLVELNLSWNHLRMDGAIAMANAMAKNTSIEVLNLSFNGFSDNGAAAMGNALAHNDRLKSLDLSHNRISDVGAIALSKGLAKNVALQRLNIGYNPITSSGGSALLMAAKEAKELIELLMKDIFLDEEAFEIIQELVRSRTKLEVTYQGITKDSGAGLRKNELALLKKKIFDKIRQYLKEKRLRMIDLFNRWDKDKSMTLSRKEFQMGIAAANIPLSDDMIEFLVNQLDSDRNGQVGYDEFVAISGIE